MNDPIHIISLGAGVQSSTMALMAACGEITPMPVAAIFADTQHEPGAVYDWLEWLIAHLPFPVVKISRGSLQEHLLRVYWSEKNEKMTSCGFPAFVLNPDGTQGLMSRQCTRDFKSDPVEKETTKQMREHGSKRSVRWLGISLDEISRVKDPRRSTVDHRYPLIELRMNRGDCLAWMQKHGFPEPPRSACTFCPYKRNEEWRRLSQEEFNAAVAFERELQGTHANGSLVGVPWLHRSMKPLDQVDLSTEEERGQLNMFNNECEGMCGV